MICVGRSVAFALALVLSTSGGDAAAQIVLDPALDNVLGTSSDALACTQLSTSMAWDATRGSDVEADARFFTTEGAPPNIHFLIDNSGSMTRLPQYDAILRDLAYSSGRGCGNAAINDYQAAKGWDYTASYPPPDKGTGEGSDTGYPNLFVEDRFYTWMRWDKQIYSSVDINAPPPLSENSFHKVCNDHFKFDTDDAQYDNCRSCLEKRGYYIREGSGGLTVNDIVFSGKFLNFNPPRYVTARWVIKDVIKDLRKVRTGMTIFDTDNSGGSLVREQNPSCKQSLSGSSSFDSNRGSFINRVNGIEFNTNTPLAETLFNIGQYFSSSDDVYEDVFGFPSKYLDNGFRNGSLRSEGRSFCWGCQVSSVIIVTDGEPTQDDDLPRSDIRNLNGGDVTCDAFGGGDACDNSLLDDVAKMLHEQDLQQNRPVVVGDLNTAGQQSMLVYGVGFAVDLPILKSASDVGGGFYRNAGDADALKDALTEIISHINDRATSFSSAAVSSFQINRVGGSLIPRLKPSKNLKDPWEGLLYRFDLGSELVLGCDPVKAATLAEGGDGDPNDLNFDGDCDDFHLIDADGKALIEDDEGVFVRYDDPLVPGRPFWEASEELKNLAAGTTKAWQARKIWTMVDSNDDGRIDGDDTPLEFTEANAAALMPYLGIANSGQSCADVASKAGLGSEMDPLTCAKMVIRWYRGADVFNPDPSKRGDDRANLLLDIFHSSPTLVDPPLSKEYCGLSRQCVQSLFLGDTPLALYASGTEEIDAYDKYFEERGGRDRLAVVGSNGGMFHFFHNGALEDEDAATGLNVFDAGSGRELFAFVPPDLLPRLKMHVGAHAAFVDSTAMAREVWIDGSGGQPRDGIKQWQEFRTMLVGGTGPGGVHRYGIDLTDVIPTSPSTTNPSTGIQPTDASVDRFFRWMWPQPGDPLALQVGESQTNIGAKAPPIGPVAIEDEDGPLEVEGVAAREQWIVFLSGGYDPYLQRGRGFAMVDLDTGDTLWRKFYGDGEPLSDELKYPVSPSMTMSSLTTGSAPEDYLFDTANVGDHGGNLWTVTFKKPGKIDASTGLVTNWYAARSFQSKAASDDAVREPFTQMVEAVVDTNNQSVLVYAGSGDRHQITDAGGDHCRLSNPRGCAAIGCGITTGLEIEQGLTTVLSSQASYKNYAYASSSLSTATAANTCGTTRIALSWELTDENGCGVAHSSDAGGGTPRLETTCSDDGTGWACRVTENDWIKVDGVRATPRPNTARFYAVETYSFTNRYFHDEEGALEYDAGRYTDSDLVDITAAEQGDNLVARGTPGWYLDYASLALPLGDERTGTAASFLQVQDGDEPCIIWNSFAPSTGEAGPVCATTGTNIARLYTAGAISGDPGCGKGFGAARFLERSTVAVPGEPISTISVVDGVSTSSVVLLEAGNTSGMQVGSNSELIQSVYQLELTEEEHRCRHEGQGCE